MRILLAHNFYRIGGGEDAVFRAEVELLRKNGHEVFTLETHNDQAGQNGRVRTALSAFHNREQARRVAALVRTEQIEIAHFHNTWLQFSPAVFRAAREAGAATLLSLHNFRLTCANGLLYRDGAPCEDCLGKPWAWRGIKHQCYRNSTAESALIASVYGWHKALGTWSTQIDRYLTLNPFARELFLRTGLPPDKLGIKPNFGPDYGKANPSEQRQQAIFIGRLSEEKGVLPLLNAWIQAGDTLQDWQLLVVGDGPLRNEVEAQVGSRPDIHTTGWLSQEEVIFHLQSSRMLLFPSTWYENFPVTIVQAYTCGVPVIANDLGAMGTIIQASGSEPDGWLVTDANETDWSGKLATALNDSDELVARGHKARARYEADFSELSALKQIEAHYRIAVEQRSGSAP